jgi:hypothetical protein
MTMAISHHANQKVLFAVGRYTGAAALLTSGDIAHQELKGFSGMLDDHLNPSELANLEPGLYVWEGTIVIDDGTGGYSDPNDPDVSWGGSIRSVGEAALFGTFLMPS